MVFPVSSPSASMLAPGAGGATPHAEYREWRPRRPGRQVEGRDNPYYGFNREYSWELAAYVQVKPGITYPVSPPNLVQHIPLLFGDFAFW